jgi:F-type H+-transporting ATPase subunit delta
MPAFVSRYATAFVEVVTDAGLDTVAIDRQLDDFLATWNGSAELRTFFVNPAVPAKQKVEILDKLNAKLGMIRQLRNLIAVLIDNDRIGAVAEVAAAYHRILQDQLGIRPAEIVTARELDKDERTSLVAEVAKLAGGKVEAKFTHEPSILGGTVVRIGSTVYDGSVRGRLERLKEALVSGQ